MKNTAELLIEIGTAEIPAAILPKLANQLRDKLEKLLISAEISFESIQTLYTPRRIALIAENVLTEIPGKVINKRGPALNIAFDQKGEPTNACIGFAKSVKAEIAELQKDEKYIFYLQEEPIKPTKSIIPEIMQQLLAKISGIKGMRWGEFDDEFIRPIYWLMVIFAKEIVPVNIFGLQSSNVTFGHRIAGKKPITIQDSNEYINKLAENFVIVEQDKRLSIINNNIKKIEKSTKEICYNDMKLLFEVNNLIEYPVILQGEFDEKFLKLPKEVLETTIIHHQRCFPLMTSSGESSARFLIVSNIAAKDNQVVVEGNQRVVQARLADAEFFYNSDISRSLNYYLDSLHSIQMHAKLGSVYQQSERISKLITKFVSLEDLELAQRAGLLAKFDLATEMVGEFPELQGIVGYYYAKFYQENENVCLAIKEQYLPNAINSSVPSTELGVALALSYRIDHLVGYFGLGIIPKGDNDPFALRRAALNIIKIILANKLDLQLGNIIKSAFDNYQVQLSNDVQKVLAYIIERLKGYYLEQQIDYSVIDAVLALNIDNINEIDQRIIAVQDFLKKDVAKDLAGSNKRIRRILLKANLTNPSKVDESQLIEDVEKKLYQEIKTIDEVTAKLLKQNKFKEILSECSALKNTINNFFDNILVMDENEKIRNNRLNLLFQLNAVFMRVANLSMLNIEECKDG